MTLHVPVGTVVYERAGRGEFVQVADMTEDGEKVVIAKGGQRRMGQRAVRHLDQPRAAQDAAGASGEEKDLRLHLKLLADVGLVGFPNAGKSTLISRISAARPKIADYPFTTLVPNLGVVGLSGHRSFVVADVPGLIEGAHEGHGLGHRFLSHLERTKVLVHLVDVSSTTARDPIEDYRGDPARAASSSRAATRPAIASPTSRSWSRPTRSTRSTSRTGSTGSRPICATRGIPLYAVSAATGDGLDPLLEAVWREVVAARERDAAALPLDDEAARQDRDTE